jgi:hypothetical protein
MGIADTKRFNLSESTHNSIMNGRRHTMKQQNAINYWWLCCRNHNASNRYAYIRSKYVHRLLYQRDASISFMIWRKTSWRVWNNHVCPTRFNVVCLLFIRPVAKVYALLVVVTFWMRSVSILMWCAWFVMCNRRRHFPSIVSIDKKGSHHARWHRVWLIDPTLHSMLW